MSITEVIVRDFTAPQPYLDCWQAMQDFTRQRTAATEDELWLVEHAPVFTQGQNGKSEHLLCNSNIPVIQSDRGGQITYHGPGQLLVYTLVDVVRRGFTIRYLVTQLENAVIQLLELNKISAHTRCKAPGVYINDKKICSIGLRIRRGCSYHGLALNVAMNLSPFSHINPCGFPELQMCQVADFIPDITVNKIKPTLLELLRKNLGYVNLRLY